MTTLREVPASKLGIKLQNYRADRPDEWTMDEFTREAEAMALRIKELEAALEEAFTISERSNEQNPSNFDQDLAWQHNEDICEIYHILKALKEGE